MCIFIVVNKRPGMTSHLPGWRLFRDWIGHIKTGRSAKRLQAEASTVEDSITDVPGVVGSPPPYAELEA